VYAYWTLALSACDVQTEGDAKRQYTERVTSIVIKMGHVFMVLILDIWNELKPCVRINSMIWLRLLEATQRHHFLELSQRPSESVKVGQKVKCAVWE
jgi:hypothetical protein